MAKKQRKVSGKAVVSEVPERPSLTQEEILKLRLFSAELKLASQEGLTAGMERQALLAKIDPQGRLAQIDARRSSAAERERQSRTQYTAILEAASKRLNIDLGSGCTIDPETGTVTVLEKQEK
jgi:hypothetical protein